MSWRRPVEPKDDAVKEDSTRWKRRDADKWRKDDEKPKKDNADKWRKDDYDKDDIRDRDRIDKDRGMEGRSVNASFFVDYYHLLCRGWSWWNIF